MSDARTPPGPLAQALELARKDLRLGERMGVWLSPLMPARYRAVEASQVAEALVTEVLAAGSSREIIENEVLSGSRYLSRT